MLGSQLRKRKKTGKTDKIEENLDAHGWADVEELLTKWDGTIRCEIFDTHAAYSDKCGKKA